MNACFHNIQGRIEEEGPSAGLQRLFSENNTFKAKDTTNAINATNEQLGIALYWEHRSFKEQGIDRKPTIHIGAVANALERKGIPTERGNINQEIIKNNMLLEQAKEMSCLPSRNFTAYSTQRAKVHRFKIQRSA